MIEVASSSPEETERIAARLARNLDVGDVVTVAGELGAGKTTFVRGACRALGVTSPVTSPTYTIGNRYRGGRLRRSAGGVGGEEDIYVSHLDLYRFGALSEADWADLEPYFEDAVAFVEWPEAGARFLPPARAAVRLRLVDAVHRVIVLETAEKPLEMALYSDC